MRKLILSELHEISGSTINISTSPNKDILYVNMDAIGILTTGAFMLTLIWWI